ncbi:MAG: hypothetical protein IIC67_07890 [Thaumarchaeota archaeon]|nr:hypothetical protein [Nitrososphaerota archaeon]
MVERLREASQLNQQESWARTGGGMGLNQGAVLADEAADEIELLGGMLIDIANNILKWEKKR